MKRSFFLICSLLSTAFAAAQTTLSGRITNARTNQPIPYVSIGVTGTTNGTVSDTTGAFILVMAKGTSAMDTLKFSSIGYQTKVFAIGEFARSPLTVVLEPSSNTLKQVNVTGIKAHTSLEGYDKNSRIFGLGFGLDGLGAQAGVVIHIGHPQTSLETLNIFIIQNPFEHLLFRVNIYDLKNGQPGENLAKENILLPVNAYRTGKVSLDLSKYGIYANKDILITLEWLEAAPATGKQLAVAAALFGHTFYRQASQSAWIKKGTGLGISVKTVY